MRYERIVVEEIFFSRIETGAFSNRDLDFDPLPFSKEITSTRPQPVRHSSSVAGELSSSVLRKRRNENIVKYP